ncbi:MAG: A24 family peptidase [Peptostreptococcaceae bacterium]
MIRDFFLNVSENVGLIIDNKIVLILLVLCFSYATYTDIKEMKIYDKFNLGIIGLRICSVFIGYSFISSNIMSSLVGFLVLLIPAMVFMHKMGGDIKFLASIGMFFYVEFMILLIALSCIYLSLYYFGQKVLSKDMTKRTLVPYAPFFYASFATIMIFF